MPPYSDNSKLSSFNPTTLTFSYYAKSDSSPYVADLDSMMSYDPDHDKLLISNFRGTGQTLTEIDPVTPDIDGKIVSQIGQPDLKEEAHAFVWSPRRHAFIVWMNILNDGKVWEVKRTGVSATGTPEYTWTLLTDATNTIIPSGATRSGSYDKFQLTTVGNDEVLIGLLNPVDGIFAFKIPAPGIATRPSPVPLTSSQTKLNLLQDLLNQLKVLQIELKKLKD